MDIFPLLCMIAYWKVLFLKFDQTSDFFFVLFCSVNCIRKLIISRKLTSALFNLTPPFFYFASSFQVVLYFIGFAVCIAIGILFIIVMPIVGCCLCCCRTCCNNCGGKQHKHDPKNARYKRRCYTTFLIIFNTFIL